MRWQWLVITPFRIPSPPRAADTTDILSNDPLMIINESRRTHAGVYSPRSTFVAFDWFSQYRRTPHEFRHPVIASHSEFAIARASSAGRRFRDEAQQCVMVDGLDEIVIKARSLRPTNVVVLTVA
jgi:hypothetical protein